MTRLVALFSVLAIASSLVRADDGSKEGLQLGFMFGPAIPNESISDVYDLVGDQSVGYAYDVASSLGYDLAAKVRFGLSDNLSFSGGVMFASFPNQSLVLKDSLGRSYNLQTTTNIIPISAGIAWIPVKSLLTPFVGAHILYSFRGTTVSDGNVVKNILSPGQEVEPQVSRMGASLNAGVEFNVGITPFIDFTYVWSNLIGNEEGEAVRAFLTVNVGLMF
jgi:hypothetical protein